MPAPAAGTPCRRRIGRPAASSTPCLAISSRKNWSGIWIRMPAPSLALRVGAHRAAVGQVLQDQQALLDDGVAFLAFDVGDKADAAGIVFVGGVVQTLWLRKAGLVHGFTSKLPA